jgi:hypothetical protein
VGGPGGVRGFNGGHGGFGSMLACMAVSFGVVTSVQACWRGQRRGGEKGRVWLFLSLIPGLMAGFWAGKMGHRQQEGLGGS